MKRYIKDLIILVLQLFMFYIFPLFAGPTDAMGMVFLIISATFLFSFILGILSTNDIKYLYPLITAVVFIPSVFIYYNESALVHASWYFAVSGIGLFVGSVINAIARKLTQKK